MKRREFIALAGAMAAWPFAARAQQAMPVIGFLRNTSPKDSAFRLTALRKGLRETGFTEGHDVAIEYRWAEGQYDRLPELVADLIGRQVAVIVASGNASSVAAKAATSTIPIIFSTGEDPVQLGLVTSLNRPGGNVTGVSFFTGPLDAKRLELLHELVPKARTIAYLMNPGSQVTMQEVQTAAASLRLDILILRVTTERELDAAFATILERNVGALLVGAGGFFIKIRDRLVALAADHALPASYEGRELTEVGGLMSYGASQPEAYRQAGVYVGRILKGAKPADLPVVLPPKYELIINIKTAKALGLRVPYSMQLLADEVIE